MDDGVLAELARVCGEFGRYWLTSKSLEIRGNPVRTAGYDRECKAQMRLKRRGLLLGIAALALGILAALAMLRLDEAPKFESLDISGVDWGRHFELTDHAGRTRTPADFRGKVVAMFFGYTQCPDVCPITMAKLGEAMKLLGEDASHVQGLFVTVDPKRDTPEVLAQYVRSFHPTFLGLYGDAQATERTAKEFKVYYQAHHANDHGAYPVDHASQVFVFDSEGRLRLLMKSDLPAEAMARDLRLLLREMP